MAEWVFGPLVKALGITPPPAPAGTPGIFALGDPALIERLLSEAGFTGIHAQVLGYVCDFDSGEELASWQFAISAPIRKMLAGQPSDRREAAWRAAADAANQHADPSGRVAVRGENVEIVAERPASRERRLLIKGSVEGGAANEPCLNILQLTTASHPDVATVSH